jgi:hypothetical protein
MKKTMIALMTVFALVSVAETHAQEPARAKSLSCKLNVNSTKSGEFVNSKQEISVETTDDLSKAVVVRIPDLQASVRFASSLTDATASISFKMDYHGPHPGGFAGFRAESPSSGIG